jgi:predicted AAA+ superfamily ATPase
MLERNFLVQQVPTYLTNLSKRIIKMKKFYFLDVGLCVRLQGHVAEDPMWRSSQIGGLFESLVHAEIVKTSANFLRNWQIFSWRTKEQAEIDFIVCSGDKIIFIETKLGIHGAKPFDLDGEAHKVFRPPFKKIVVSAGEEIVPLDRETLNIPVKMLGAYLLGELD